MAKLHGSSSMLLMLITVLMTGLSLIKTEELSLEYYAESCPQAENIIHGVVSQKQKEAFSTAAGVLRIFFHDCFIQGCDASIMLVSTRNNTAEKDAEENRSLPGDGFDAIMRAKTALELACPGVVSCADILSIAARDLVSMVGGPFWPVLKGRKDGRVSLASNVAGHLPLPSMNVDQLLAVFGRKGFTLQEMVALSGAHTIGFAHCERFQNRIWNYSTSLDIDPSMSPAYAKRLRQACPNEGRLDPTVVAFNDVTTPLVFDNAYFRNMKKRLGLMASDQALWSDPRTRPLVKRLARSQDAFFSAWVPAVQKLSLLLLPHQVGEVRKHCNVINP